MRAQVPSSRLRTARGVRGARGRAAKITGPVAGVPFRFCRPGGSSLGAGRDPEVERLLTLVDDIHPDGPKVGLVSGWSGIGKSALVGEVHRPLSERHGYFVVGKSEPHTRHVPYFSLLQALADLCNQLLTEPEEQIAT